MYFKAYSDKPFFANTSPYYMDNILNNLTYHVAGVINYSDMNSR